MPYWMRPEHELVSVVTPANTILSVLDLTPRRIGGMETMLRELSRQLGQRGCRSVLCFRSLPAGPVREFLTLENVRLEAIGNLSRWSPASQWRLASLLRRYRPEVLHLNFVDLFAPFARVARLCGVPRVVYTDHISRPVGFLPQRAAGWKRAAYRVGVPVDTVFCVSDYVRSCWLASGLLQEDRLVTLYNGVDVERCDRSLSAASAFRAAHSLPPEAIIVTQVASMIPDKGFDTLLEAAASIAPTAANVHFVLAGDGPRRSQLEASARERGLANRIHFTGLVGDPVAEGLFASSDIVCQASNWNEAFGLTIAEGMACGKPVVATRVGAIPELVKDGETGLLVERGDAAALAGAILRLVHDLDLRRSLGAAGRRHCRNNFDHRANAAQMISMYGLPEALAEPANREPNHVSHDEPHRSRPVAAADVTAFAAQHDKPPAKVASTTLTTYRGFL